MGPKSGGISESYTLQQKKGRKGSQALRVRTKKYVSARVTNHLNYEMFSSTALLYIHLRVQVIVLRFDGDPCNFA